MVGRRDETPESFSVVYWVKNCNGQNISFDDLLTSEYSFKGAPNV